MKKREIPQNIQSDLKPIKPTYWCLSKYHWAKKWWNRDYGHFNEELYFKIVDIKSKNEL